MKWSAPVAAAFLAMAYVHFAAVTELGGNPAPVAVWLVLYVCAAIAALKHALDPVIDRDDEGSSRSGPAVAGSRARAR